MKRKITLILAILSLSYITASSQCMIAPVSLENRITKSTYIVEGTITEQTSYIDPVTTSVFTRNKLVVNAWLKNSSNIKELYVITLGGVYGNKATIVNPSLQLEKNAEYILMLEENNLVNDDKLFRSANPTALQVMAYADGQGALKNQFNKYHDLLVEPVMSEADMFNRISKITKEKIVTPQGTEFFARQVTEPYVARTMAISGFAPTTTNAGTIDPGDQITITGSGFGASAGTVFFSNADDGGATFTSSGIASDIVSWADGSITVKVARRAGTGPINVNGSMTSASNLTVGYSHIDINSTFSGFGSSTRQRYYLRNINGLGGYTFLYNTTSGMTDNAIKAFERSLASWRCNSGINFRSGGTTATATVASDGTNAVFFDASLPAGILGRATSQFSGSATGGCNLTNTVWWLADVDIQYAVVPSVGFTWQYGPSNAGFTEYDFEAVTVHELGHALGLGHRIAPGDVMHYALSNGSSPRTPSATEIAGANNKLAYSTTATCFNPATSGTQMISASTTRTWLGTSNSTWATAGNWACNSLPGSSNDVIIPLANNQPSISSGTASVNNLLVNSGAALTNSSNLQVAGSITVNGTINTSAGNVEFNGITAQNIPTSAFVSNNVKNLTINNSAGVTLLGTLNVTGILTPTLGTFNTGGLLTLKSTSIANTALVGVVGGTVNGNVTVERFIPAGGKRAFRFLTPGVTTSNFIRDNWQEGVNNTVIAYGSNQNPNAGYGTHITGSISGSNGFDATLSGTSSLFTFNNSTQAWVAAANTNATVLTAGNAYRLFIRGNRSFDLTNTSPSSVNTALTLRATGALRTGTLNMTSLGGSVPVRLAANNSEYSFIGNPYQAPLDWHLVLANTGTTNIATTYYSWDPILAGVNAHGKYVSYNQATLSNSDGASSIGRYIQPGQAFFIQNTGAAPTLEIKESNKAIAEALTTVFRTTQADIKGRMWVRLYYESLADSGSHSDGVGIVFSNDFTKNLEADDSYKLNGSTDNLSIESKGQLLSITGLPLPSHADTVQLSITNISSTNYVLKVDCRDFSFNTIAWLVDNYTGTKHSINTSGIVSMPFIVNNEPASKSPTRFTIIFDEKKQAVQESPFTISLSPNPASSYITAKYSLNGSDNLHIRIINSNGQIVLTKQLGKIQGGGIEKMNIRHLSSGNYTFELSGESGKKAINFIKL